MGRIQENNIRRDQVVSAIRILMENQGIDSGSDWDSDRDNLRKLGTLADGSTGCTVYSGDLGITQEEDETKLIFAVDSGEPDFFQQQLPSEAVRALTESGTKTVQLVFFVRNMQSRIFLESKLDSTGLKDLRKAIRGKASKSALPAKTRFKLLTNYVLLQEYEAQDVSLTNLHPLEMLHEPPVDRSINRETDPEHAGSVQARVFTVDLYQLVQKYNLIGDILFENNVRFGINEALGVEQSIRETLASEPEKFWYKNNGVTFLIQNSHTFLQEAKTVRLGRLDPAQKRPPFSVINGAQTITTAARYFFGLEAKADKDTAAKKEYAAAKQDAHVLVRVINVINSDNAKIVKDSKAISVALNRQKPIRMDDIAFTHPAVLKLAEYLRNTKDAPFTLVRQGETATDVGSIDLISFARARMACAGYPGTARTKGRDKLLELKTSEDGSTHFAQAELFSPDWLDAEDEEKEAQIFLRDYQAIRFAHQLAKSYEVVMRKYESDNIELRNAVKNGKWYFTAIITQIMNLFQPDYSNFSAGILSDLPHLMESLARMMILEAHRMDDGKEVNSNLFKAEKLYNRMIGCLKLAHTLNSLLPPISDDQILQLISAGSVPAIHHKNNAIDTLANYVMFEERRFDVSSDAQALVEIAQYVLSTYPAAESELLYNCSWLTRITVSPSNPTGSFWSNGKRYNVDTNANWEDKRRRMTKLCKVARVSPGTVKWHKPGDSTFTFSW